MRALSIAWVVLAASIGGACAAKGGEGDAPVAQPDASKGEVAPTEALLRIDPAEVSLVANLDGTSTAATVRVFERASASAPEVDVTDSATFTLGDPGIATVAGNTISKATRGGVTTILARTANAPAGTTAKLRVRLIGDAYLAGTDPTTKAAFDGAILGADATKSPAIEYPLDGAIVPRNVPPMEVQWTASADANVWRVRLKTDETLDVAIYSKAREALLAAAQWTTVTESAAGNKVTMVVEALGASGLFASGAVSVTVARDRIDDTSIFYWESSSGSMKVLDFASGKLAPLPVTGSAWMPGSPSKCVACHTVSRDGTRFAYTSANIELGTLAANKEKTTFVATIEPGAEVAPGFRWTHGVFNPREADTVPALLVTKADKVPENSAGHVRLALIDPDTGAEVASNLAEWLASFPAGVPRDQLQPDWSNGGVIVFTAYDSEMPNPDPTGSPAKAYVRLLGDDSVAASIVEASVTWDAAAKKFVFGAPKVLVKPAPGASFDVMETNALPQISPDESLVAFSRTNGWWPVKNTSPPLLNISGRVLVVRRSDGKVIELKNINSAPNSDVTQPQWAPTIGTDYAWLAFSAERPYGHRMSKDVALPTSCFSTTTMTLCKNMWITAIDRKTAASGDLDPSNVPFWMPGQTPLASAVSPRWTKTAVKVVK